MRWTTFALFLLAATASAASFTEASGHLGMTVDREAGHYKIVVTDLDSKQEIATVNLEAAGVHVGSADFGDLHTVARVRLGKTEDFVRATVTRNGSRVDSVSLVAPLPPGEQRSVVAEPFRVGGDVRPPRVIQRVEATYPPELRAQRISGIVILEAEISATGDVQDVEVLKGQAGLAEAALEAVRQWKFEPATMNGQPIPVIFNLTVNFKIN